MLTYNNLLVFSREKAKAKERVKVKAKAQAQLQKRTNRLPPTASRNMPKSLTSFELSMFSLDVVVRNMFNIFCHRVKYEPRLVPLQLILETCQ